MESDDRELGSVPSFGTITFGGSNVQNNHFLSANGNVRSQTGTVNGVGTAFVVGQPMRLFRVTSHKSNNNTQANFHVLKNEAVKPIVVVTGTFDLLDLPSNFVLARADVLQVRSNVTVPSPAPGTILLSFYFYTLPEQLPLYPPLQLAGEGASGLNILTFSGANVTVARSFWKFNGNVNSAVTTDVNAPANSCIIGAPMVIRRMTWHKSSKVTNGVSIHSPPNNRKIVLMNDISGVVDVIPPFALKMGDAFQVAYFIYDAGHPGTSVVSFYCTPT